MSADEALWISEREVTELVDIADAIEALSAGLRLEAEGQAQNMVKTHATFGGHDTLHAIGATFEGAGFVGTKTWAHTAGGAAPLLILFDSHTGAVKAIIEAFALGQLRTGAISGLATEWLAAPEADDMALIGTGKQALSQLAAVAAVRRLRRVRIFGRNAERCRAFLARARAELGLAVEGAASVEEAVKSAAIVTLVTRATEPFLYSGMVAKGAHINAVGAIVPECLEFEPALLDRCAVIAVDNVAQVRKLSREFLERLGQDEQAWARVKPLSAVIAAGSKRPAGADLTLFKAMGMGISDLALGIEIHRRAAARGLGRPLPERVAAKPRLTREVPARMKQGA